MTTSAARRSLIACAAIASCAWAYYASAGLGTFWPAAWIAPLPILLLASSTTGRTTALAATAAYFLGSFELFAYLARVMPIVLVALVLLAPALAFAAAVTAARSAGPRLTPWIAAFVFPAAWTSYEFLLSRVSPHGTALSVAYSQTDVLPLLQLASLVGLSGITFVLMLVPSACAVAWTRRAPSALLPVLAIVFGAVGFGEYRLHQRTAAGTVRVGLTATDRGIAAAFATDNAALAVAVANEYRGRIARLAAGGAQVIVLPEKFVGITPDDSRDVLSVFSEAARDAHAVVVAGVNRVGISPLRNDAIVFGPDGAIVAEYEKHHLLPGPETGYVVGSSAGFFSGPGTQWGVAICKDMDFPGWSRQYGRGGARLLAVPAWDFVVDGRLHSRMAVVRGVENGFGIVRVAQQGLLTLSDAYGGIVLETPSSGAPEALLVGDIAPGPGATIYTRYGDWFGWAIVFALAALLIAARLRSSPAVISSHAAAV